MKKEVIELLIKEAIKARDMAYAPYSKYLVGAALVVPSGNIYTGCNVENASFGLTVCAERVAVFNAISDGHRHIDAIAIYGAPIHPEYSNNIEHKNSDDNYAYPCGACRQVLTEFLPKNKDMDVIVVRSLDDYRVYKLSELMPHMFLI